MYSEVLFIISKKHLIFLLLVCMIGIFLISSASASDLNETVIQSSEDVLIGEIEGNQGETGADVVDDNVGINDSNIISANYAPKNSNEIQSYIDGANESDTIIFNGTYVIGNTIVVNKPVTFVGINDATIDGNNCVGLFNILTSGVIFKNITFKNGNSATNGGAINSANANYTASVVNSKFINNVAKNYGGAIYNVNAKNCSFIDNSVSVNAGGAIYNGNAVNCSFTNNHAISAGGAIFRGSAVNSRFEGNYVNKNGGAVCDIDVINCSFTNNSAKVDGGAIYNGNAWKCSFFSNSASYGGAIYDGDAENCTFVGNSVTAYGGAVNIGSAVNCIFINNSAKSSWGGAINYVDAMNCSFIGNSAYNGGAMTRGTAVNCSFVNNSAGGYGGAIRETNSINCSFVNNNAYSAGGAIFGGSAVNCRFENNTVTKNGGASSNSYSINCIFVNNYADIAGGAIFGGSAVNSSFVNNSARYNSGAIYLYGLNNVINCYFEGNHAKSGAVFRIENRTGVVLENLTCINNYANTHGGALEASGSNLTMRNCNFTNCHANQNEGGALYFDKFDNLNIIDCNFKDCYSVTYGGSIILKASTNVCVSNSNFINSSSNYGGSVSCRGETRNFTLLNSSFINSFSNIHSGALDCYKSEDITIKDCEFVNCSSVSSGTMRLYSVDAIVVENCQFENCSSTNEGGALYCNEGENLKMDSCSFKNCTSQYGDYINFGEISDYYIVDCIFDAEPNNIDFNYDSILDINDLSVVHGDDIILNLTLSTILGSLSNKILKFDIEGNTYTKRTFSDGSCIFNITEYLPNLGTYDITISYEGEGRNNSVSKTINVRVNTFIGNLTVETIGKYYGDTFLTFKLTDFKTGEAIDRVPIKVIFSNGKTSSFATDSNGGYTYRVPYAPGSYNITAYVDVSNVDVNTVKLNNLMIHEINGKIDFIFSEGSRNLNVVLYNPDNGDFYRNVKVTLEFNNGAYAERITGDDGIATYRIPFGPGTYSVLAHVDGDFAKVPIAELNNIVITEESDLGDDNPSEISFGNDISFDYLKSGSTTFATVGCSIQSSNITVVGHPEIKPKLSGNKITVSGLSVGTYTLRVITTPNEGYYSVIGTAKITVKKVSAKISVKKISLYHKEGKKWTIKLIDTKTGKGIANMVIKLKVFTGKNSKSYSVKTNSKGVATFKNLKKLSVGKHKVTLSFSKYGYDCKSITTTVKVLKQTKVKYTVKTVPRKDGTSVSIWIKIGKKPIKKGVKFNIYVPKRKKPVTVVTGTFNKVNKGFVGYGTNLLSAGTHKITIKPVGFKYTGSKTIKIKIKKGTNKYKKSETIISKGKKAEITHE